MQIAKILIPRVLNQILIYSTTPCGILRRREDDRDTKESGSTRKKETRKLKAQNYCLKDKHHIADVIAKKFENPTRSAL